jgi:hypothetical protein
VDRGSDTSGGIHPRSSSSSRWVLGLRVLGLACFVLAIVSEHGLRLALIGAAAGLLLIPIALRRKGPRATDTVWSASADLVQEGMQFPGQLSLTTTALIWTPSSYSLERGKNEVAVQLESGLSVNLEAGPALLDVFVEVANRNGDPERFLTHRSPVLRRAIRQLGTGA